MHDKCYHCSEECIDEHIFIEDKVFCCQGCKLVYELLSDNKLDDYYAIEQNPGIKPKTKSYDMLLNEDVASRFITYQDDDTVLVKLFIPKIHCSSCIWLLENLHQINNNVSKAEVNFVKKEVSLQLQNKDQVVKETFEFLNKLGYPPALDPEKKKSTVDKRLILQLAIAGFCFGNIMLLSFPEYLFTDGNFIRDFRPIFSYIIFGLSIPILLYSARDYLISAYNGIIYKKINIDIPISVGILVLYIKSVSDIFTFEGPGYMDSFAGFIFFLLVGKWFQSKTYQAMSFERDYKSYFPMAVEKVNESGGTVAIENLKIGDRILIKNEEIIPADSILISHSSQIDYSFVTGESNKKTVVSGHQIFAGGQNYGQAIQLEVVKPVNQSYLTQLWNNDDGSASSTNKTENELLSKRFIIALLFISAIGAIVWSFIDPTRIVSIVTAILIVACPCALAISEPFTYGNAIRILSRKKLFLKNAHIIELMSSITDIVFDKTGTITKSNQQEIQIHSDTQIEKEDFNAIYSIVNNSSHPLSQSIKLHLKRNGSTLKEVIDFEEKTSKGLEGTVEGKIYRVGSEKFVCNKSSSDYTRVYISKDDHILGFFQFSNQYRKSINKTISRLKKEYNLHVLTGDNQQEKKNLIEMFGSTKNLNFEQLPQDKYDYIEHLQQENKNVLMIGDGLNDAGALKRANVGFVVAEDVFNFSPACDGIIEANQLKYLDQFLSFSKKSKSILKACYIFSIFYNIIGLSFAFSGNLSPVVAAILMPISSISIVLISTVLSSVLSRKINTES